MSFISRRRRRKEDEERVQEKLRDHEDQLKKHSGEIERLEREVGIYRDPIVIEFPERIRDAS